MLISKPSGLAESTMMMMMYPSIFCYNRYNNPDRADEYNLRPRGDRRAVEAGGGAQYRSSFSFLSRLPYTQGDHDVSNGGDENGRRPVGGRFTLYHLFDSRDSDVHGTRGN